MSGGGGGVSPRELTAQELSLIDQQTAILKQAGDIFGRQGFTQEQILPYALQAMGFNTTSEPSTLPNPQVAQLQEQLKNTPQFIDSEFGQQVNPAWQTIQDQIASLPATVAGPNRIGIGGDQFLEKRFLQQGLGLDVSNKQLGVAQSQLDRALAQSDIRSDLADMQLEAAQKQQPLRNDLATDALQIARNDLLRQSQLQGSIQDIEAGLLPQRAGLESAAIGTDLQRLQDAQRRFGQVEGLERSDLAMQPARLQAEGGALARLNAALAGDIPVNPALLRDLAKREETFQESLRRSLGPDFIASTPGLEGVIEFEDFRNRSLEQARRDDLITAANLAQSQATSNRALSDALFGRTTAGLQSPGVSATGNSIAAATMPSAGMNALQMALMGNPSFLDPTASGTPFLGAGNFGQGGLTNAFGFAGAPGSAGQGLLGVSQGFGAPLGAFQNQSNQQLQADIANAQSGNALMGGLGQLAGTLGGAMIFKSSRAIKDRVGEAESDKAVDAVKRLPVDLWRYKGDDKDHIGTYAEDFREITGLGDGRTIDVIDALGLLTAAVKGLIDRIEALETRHG